MTDSASSLPAPLLDDITKIDQSAEEPVAVSTTLQIPPTTAQFGEIYFDIIESLSDETTDVSIATTVTSTTIVIEVNSGLAGYPAVMAEIVTPHKSDAQSFALMSLPSEVLVNSVHDPSQPITVKFTFDPDLDQEVFTMATFQSTLIKPILSTNWVTLTVYRSSTKSNQWVFTATNSSDEKTKRQVDYAKFNIPLPSEDLSSVDIKLGWLAGSASIKQSTKQSIDQSTDQSINRSDNICEWQTAWIRCGRSDTMRITVPDHLIPSFVNHFYSSSLIVPCSFVVPYYSPSNVRVVRVRLLQEQTDNLLLVPWVRTRMESGPNYCIPLQSISTPKSKGWFNFG